MLNQPAVTSTCLICDCITAEIHYKLRCCLKCKIFFRRHANRDHGFRCSNSKECNLTNKNKCKACRMHKCLQIGLSMEAVVEWKEKRKVSLENKILLNFDASSFIEANPCYAIETLEIKNDNKHMEMLVYTERKFQKFRDFVYHNPKLSFLSIEEMFGNDCELGKCDRENMKPFYCMINGQPNKEFHYKKDLFGSRLFDSLFLALDFIKIFPVFNNLSDNDRRSLIRFVSPSIATIDICYYSYKLNWGWAIMPDGFEPIKYIGSASTYDITVNVKPIEYIIKLNPSFEEHCLMKILLYLNSSVLMSAEGKELLETEKQKYGTILLKYLQLNYGHIRGATRFAEIIKAVGTMYEFGEKMKGYYNIQAVLKASKGAKDTRIIPPFLDFVLN